MKKLMLLIAVLCIAVVFSMKTPDNASAVYYKEQFPEHQDTLDNVLDIMIKIDPKTVKSLSLEQLVLYPGCDLDSPDGSTHSIIEEKVVLGDFNHEIIKKTDTIIIRIYDNDLEDLNPSSKCKECDPCLSGTVKITPLKGDSFKKSFVVSSKNYRSILIKTELCD